MVKILTFILSFLSVMPLYAQERIVTFLDFKADKIQEEKNSEKVACELFRPTKEQITRYFYLARESQDFGPLEDKYYSPCIAAGSVKFAGGSKGEWMLHSSGLGYVYFPSGELISFFNKNNPWIDPLSCTYDTGNSPEC